MNTATAKAAAALAEHVARQTTDALMAAKVALGGRRGSVESVAIRAINDELAARRAAKV